MFYELFFKKLNLNKIFSLLIIVFLLNACIIQKRVHLPGFYFKPHSIKLTNKSKENSNISEVNNDSFKNDTLFVNDLAIMENTKHNSDFSTEIFNQSLNLKKNKAEVENLLTELIKTNNISIKSIFKHKKNDFIEITNHVLKNKTIDNKTKRNIKRLIYFSSLGFIFCALGFFTYFYFKDLFSSSGKNAMSFSSKDVINEIFFIVLSIFLTLVGLTFQIIASVYLNRILDVVEYKMN